VQSVFLASATVLIAVYGTGCSGPVTTTLDEPPASVHSSNTAADVSDCRFQANRQAEMRYPRQVNEGRNIPWTATAVDEPARSDAAQRYFMECLRQKARMELAKSKRPSQVQ